MNAPVAVAAEPNKLVEAVIDGVPYGFVRSAFYPDPSSYYDLEQIKFLNGLRTSDDASSAFGSTTIIEAACIFVDKEWLKRQDAIHR